MSGRSKPPFVVSGIQLCVIPVPHDDYPHNTGANGSLSTLELSYTFDELQRYVTKRKFNLSKSSFFWIDTAGRLLWEYTRGCIKQNTLEELKNYVISYYQNRSTWNKVLCFVESFLKYISRLYLNPQYSSFILFLERPRQVKERKIINKRRVTVQDLNNVFNQITEYYQNGKIPYSNYIDYISLVGFGCYTAQRTYSTIKKITVGMVREALKNKQYPFLTIPPMMDKIRYEHYVPLHPCLVPILKETIKNKSNNELMFRYIAFNSWIIKNPIPLTQFKGIFKPSDLRKFGEQYGDQIGWETVNKAHIMSHDISSISFTHYKSFTPEMVYKIYMKAWTGINLIPDF